MRVLNVRSLGKTLDGLNDAFFHGRSLPRAERDELEAWVASRQGKAGAYADMFAPTAHDFAQGVTLFTGETVRTRAGTAHILGEEACRALILLGVRKKDVADRLERATRGMSARLSNERRAGMYCCGRCSCALWRHLAAGGLDDAKRRLVDAVKALKAHRDGKGRWRVFPFYYSLLALSEMDPSITAEEMRYAAPVCERYVKRAPKGDIINARRRTLTERILSQC